MAQKLTVIYLILFKIKELTGAKYTFLVPLLQSNEEGVVQVVNDELLENEIRFSVSGYLSSSL